MTPDLYAFREHHHIDFNEDYDFIFRSANTQDTNHVNRMTISPSGMIGIGTDTLNEMLEVTGNILAKHSDTPRVILDNTSTRWNLEINNGLESLAIADLNNGLQKLNFELGASGNSFFDNFGNLGVGTNTPTEKFHVSGNGLFTGTLKSSTVEADIEVSGERILVTYDTLDLLKD